MADTWITCRNVALHLSILEAEPGAPVVVFTHGMGQRAAFYSSMVPGSDFLCALRDEGLTVMALDLQGHGLSEGRRGHIPFRDGIANIKEAVGFAVERYSARVGLAGSGLGAFLSFYAGMEDDRVGAVACHTIADLRAIGRFEPALRRRALAACIGRARRAARTVPLVPLPLRAVYPPEDVFEDEENRSRWRALPRVPRWYSLDSIVSIFLTPDDKPAIEAMTKPVLAVTGGEDRIVPVAGQREFVSRLPDEAELFVLGGAGHMVPLEHLPQIAPRMGEWLRKRL